mmetsp:Transcript_28058/g.91718  ORF Transcript_28058/g.91718 Transcript_28058/m.91718 type:complete len:634 (+) Transcript_28058:22-1923(+)
MLASARAALAATARARASAGVSSSAIAASFGVVPTGTGRASKTPEAEAAKPLAPKRRAIPAPKPAGAPKVAPPEPEKTMGPGEAAAHARALLKEVLAGGFFASRGVGGLEQTLSPLLRRVLASRTVDAAEAENLGLKHVRGVLFHGPPGTGKTLVARQLSKALSDRPPKVVSGPEMLNRFVGQSEENARSIFAEAEVDQRKLGHASPLHVIVLDEADALLRRRGEGGGGQSPVGDNVVNSFLAKLDGVTALNNVLLVATTNRPDRLDPAVLRPGRLELQVELGLPDEPGRVEVLQCHLQGKTVAEDIDVRAIAKLALNFSGAELEAVVSAALSKALTRAIEDAPTEEGAISAANLRITHADLVKAVSEAKPQFGTHVEALAALQPLGLLPPHLLPRAGPAQKSLDSLCERVLSGHAASLTSVLVTGSPGTGKSALAASALSKGFSVARVVRPGSGDAAAREIADAFAAAHSSGGRALVLLDDVERLVSGEGASAARAALARWLRQPPIDPGARVLVVATAANAERLPEELRSAFSQRYRLQSLAPKRAAALLHALGCVTDEQALAELLPPATPLRTLLSAACEGAYGAGAQGLVVASAGAAPEFAGPKLEPAAIIDALRLHPSFAADADDEAE